jgi:uncharacterized protein (DUF1330 family)
MASWADFERAAPELAAFGRVRLDGWVAYLATVDGHGAPRVHPVSPWFADGGLFIRMYPNSPKVADLERDPRYALHSPVDDHDGTAGEFAIRGRAALVVEPQRLSAANEGKAATERYVVLEFDVEDVIATTYDGDETARRRWRA